MPHDASELQQRIDQSTPQDTVKGSLFRSVLAELERRVPGHPRLPELKGQFGKSAWSEFSNFPVAEYLRLVYQGAELLEPNAGGFSQGLTELGAIVATAFLHSAVGKLALTMGSGKDPIALLSFAPSVYAVSANYGKRTFVRRAPDEGALQLRRDFLPAEYHLGVVQAGVRVNGHEAHVEVQPISLLDCDVVVRALKRA